MIPSQNHRILKLEGPVYVLFNSTPSFMHVNNYEILFISAGRHRA